MGSVGAMNLKFDIFLDPGVTVNIARATRCTLLGAPNVISVNYNPDDVIRATSNLPRPDGSTVVAIDFPIRCYGMDTYPEEDFQPDRYTPVATVKITVTSETKPSSGTFFRQRPTILEEDASIEFPLWGRSFWGSAAGPTFDGFFENQPDFHLPCLEEVTPAFTFDFTQRYCVGETPVDLPEISNNGITGTWSPEAISTDEAGTQTYTFTPDEGQCVIGDGIVQIEVTVTQCLDGFTLKGTVFPFVDHIRPEMMYLNEELTVTVELHAVPNPATTSDPIARVLSPRLAVPLHTVTAVYYDGTDFVPGTPYPGMIGRCDNAGLPIDWQDIKDDLSECQQGTPVFLEEGEVPERPINIGVYTFENVAAGDYILVIKRVGFLPRIGKITVDREGIEVQYLGHREIIGGDANGDRVVDGADIALITKNDSHLIYNAACDIDGNGFINSADASLSKFYLGFGIEVYQETKNWVESFFNE